MRQTRSTKTTKVTTSKTSPTENEVSFEPPRVVADGDPELAQLAHEANSEIAQLLTENPKVEAKKKGPKPKPKMTAEALDEEQVLADVEITDLPEEFSEADLQIKPAETLIEFSHAIALAKAQRTPSIKASKKVIFHWNKPHYPKNFFFYFEGIRVDEVGKEQEIDAYLNGIAGENNFGN